MSNIRTERCPDTRQDVKICECIKHRDHARGSDRLYKVPRAEKPKRCAGTCRLAKASVQARELPTTKNPVYLCDDCFEARKLRDAAKTDRSRSDGAVDWSAVNATLRRSG